MTRRGVCDGTFEISVRFGRCVCAACCMLPPFVKSIYHVCIQFYTTCYCPPRCATKAFGAQKSALWGANWVQVKPGYTEAIAWRKVRLTQDDVNELELSLLELHDTMVTIVSDGRRYPSIIARSGSRSGRSVRSNHGTRRNCICCPMYSSKEQDGISGTKLQSRS